MFIFQVVIIMYWGFIDLGNIAKSTHTIVFAQHCEIGQTIISISKKEEKHQESSSSSVFNCRDLTEVILSIN